MFEQLPESQGTHTRFPEVGCRAQAALCVCACMRACVRVRVCLRVCVRVRVFVLSQCNKQLQSCTMLPDLRAAVHCRMTQHPPCPRPQASREIHQHQYPLMLTQPTCTLKTDLQILQFLTQQMAQHSCKLYSTQQLQ